MAMGSFPIQTSTACACEWIENGRTGFIVDPNDSSTIAESIRTALRDDELVDSAAESNRMRIEAQADNRLIGKRARQVYAEILENSSPALTVITPTYNRGRYLAETIESVLSQEFQKAEYIILDDGSTDDTTTIVDRYLHQANDRFPTVTLRYIRHDNIGETRTVNKGLSMVRGEFFTIVNSDDPLLPGCLKKVVSALRSQPKALAAYPDWCVVNANSEPIRTVRLPDYDIDNFFTLGSVSVGPGACFRSTVLDLIGYRNPLLRYSADLDYWFRLALVGPPLHVPEVLATHRVHPTSASISEKGTRLADETGYLLSSYIRHPLLGARRRYKMADAHAQFAAIFACSNLLQAKRCLVRSIGTDPIGTLRRCEHGGAKPLSRMFAGLGATRTGLAERFFRKAIEARSRVAGFSPAARGILCDPIGMIDLAQLQGTATLINLLRKLPQHGAK
jgi:glycosyltransferase involved in cell wall biosynthesis